ncbi:hypothetical protein B1A85_13790 [Chroococcidiopsis sp. TS-821]|nr:hypothetical protein B1A85_13790 [Chroococcidiopsis sp. TS-821]
MGFTFTTFILPQAIALVDYPGAAPERSIKQVLFMACLCIFMCWLGYKVPIPSSWLQKPVIHLNFKRLKMGAAVYVGIGLFFWSLVYSRPEAASLNQHWSGIITIYIFLAQLLNIGFTILLLETIKKPTRANILLLTIAVFMPLYRAFFAGRRTSLSFIFFSVALSVYFVRKRCIPRVFFVFAIFAATLVLFNIAQYRSFLMTGDWDLLRQINPIENLHSLINQNGKSTTLELRNAALLIDSVNQNSQYEFGTGYWDTIVFRWLPAQFLGSDFKESLKFNFGINHQSAWYELYGYKYPTGSTTTGIGDSFAQFDYFGSLVFGIIAFFFKYLWHRSLYRQDYVAQIAYILLITSAMTAITHGTANFIPELLYYILFLLPLLLWSRENRKLSNSSSIF